MRRLSIAWFVNITQGAGHAGCAAHEHARLYAILTPSPTNPPRNLTHPARIAPVIKEETPMTVELWLGAFVALVVMVYLVAVLARPEKF